MKKYKVLVIQILLKNNKTADFGEVVEEDQLSSDPQVLIDGKFISEFSKEDQKKDEEAAEKFKEDKQALKENSSAGVFVPNDVKTPEVVNTTENLNVVGSELNKVVEPAKEVQTMEPNKVVEPAKTVETEPAKTLETGKTEPANKASEALKKAMESNKPADDKK